MRPSTELTDHVPPELFGDEHAVAKKTWRRVLGLYAEVDGAIATAFDRDTLIQYCLIVEEIEELAAMRRVMKSDWEAKRKEVAGMRLDVDDQNQWVKAWEVVNALYQKFQGLDARLDGKRKHLHTLQQSLYLTPRSRAGVVPPPKEVETQLSMMEQLLGE